MSRRRGQRTGHLFEKSGSWLLSYRVDARDANGDMVRARRSETIGPARGPDRISKREAERLASERLQEIDHNNLNPSSLMTVEQFVGRDFQPHLWTKKPAGQKHYKYVLENILPVIGAKRLCDVDTRDVEALVRHFYAKGLSVQTVRHFKNGVSAIFTRAIKLRMYRHQNPARGVELPEEHHPKRRPTLSWEQAGRVISALKSPYRQMAILSMMTSMNIAEICGLRWRRCNLTDQIVSVDGEVMAPYTLAIRENCYEGKFGSLKTGSRRRNVALTPELARMLEEIKLGREKWVGPDDPVFAAERSEEGRPVDAHNVSNRQFRPLSKRLGFAVAWHAFRRAHSTFVGEMPGVSIEDRMRMMGHSQAQMTLHYSIDSMEGQRKVVAFIQDGIMGKPKGGVQ